MSSDGKKSYVGGKAGDDDLRANYNDADGTIINGGLGDDILRGGSYNDILNGGGGDDQYFGGGGADQFRFFGTQIDGPSDTDYVYDLNFGEGDTIVLGDFAAGSFTSAGGVNSFDGGDSAIISSYEGLANLVADSASVTASRKGDTDVLIITITDGDGQIQEIHLSNSYAAYTSAGGELGV